MYVEDYSIMHIETLILFMLYLTMLSVTERIAGSIASKNRTIRKYEEGSARSLV
jgi:hypothetical protein